MSALAQQAARVLATDALPGGLEGLWQRAALVAIATGEQVDPALPALMQLTMPDRAWAEVPAWPSDVLTDRCMRLRDTHLLAISLGETSWLSQLDACWSHGIGTVDELTVLRARGEIRLAMGEPGWPQDDLDALLEDGFLVAAAPADRAWLALARGDVDRARRELVALDDLLSLTAQQWQAAPDEGIRQIRAYPGAVLRVESRALRALTQ